jgi:hypothetical protein
MPCYLGRYVSAMRCTQRWANTEGGPAHSLIERETPVRKFSRNAPAARIVVCLLTDPKLISSAFRQGTEPSRSPKATVELLQTQESLRERRRELMPSLEVQASNIW